MKLWVTVFALGIALSGCAASNYAHQNFDTVANQKFVDPNTKQEYYIRDKPAEGRMKMMLGAGSSVGMLFGGQNSVPPTPLYEAAAVKFLASQGRTCTVSRSFEIVMSELEIQYSCG
jgi:hypothetical protein